MRIRQLGLVDYASTYAAMQQFTQARQSDTPDEMWLCEHHSVFTQGLAGKPEHVLHGGQIPVVQTDRGGQITHHGPGQVVAYPLLDLRRLGYFAKEYVYRLEEAVIRSLMHWGVTGQRVRGAPGIYVRLDDPLSHARLPDGFSENDLLPTSHQHVPLGKIAALGLKISRHCTYHGVALNVAMDLSPYQNINPCGYAGLPSVDLFTMGVNATWNEAADVFAHELQRRLAP